MKFPTEMWHKFKLPQNMLLKYDTSFEMTQVIPLKCGTSSNGTNLRHIDNMCTCGSKICN